MSKWGVSYAHKASVFANTPWWKNEALETLRCVPAQCAVALDVGCNMGAWEHLARDKGHTFKIHAMDVNEYAVQALADQKLPEVETHTTLDTVPDGLDFVIMMHVINQIEDIEDTLAKVWQRMQSGATIVVVTHNPIPGKFRKIPNMIKGYKPDATMVREPHLGELRQMMYDNGFQEHTSYFFGPIKLPLLKLFNRRMIYVGTKP